MPPNRTYLKPGLNQTDPASYHSISNMSFISKLVKRVLLK